MADDLTILTADDGVVEHMNADFIVVPRIVGRVLEMPNQFACVYVECDRRVGIKVVPRPCLRIVLWNRISGAPDRESGGGIVGTCLPDAAAARLPRVILVLP